MTKKKKGEEIALSTYRLAMQAGRTHSMGHVAHSWHGASINVS